MPRPARIGEVFNEFAEQYDARRSGYPRAIVDAAVELASLAPGSRVVEVGAGTGKLTEKAGRSTHQSAKPLRTFPNTAS